MPRAIHRNRIVLIHQARWGDAVSEPTDPKGIPTIVNFGGNVRFTPRNYFRPRTEQDVLEILNQHANGKIRVVGSLHSWNRAVVCDDAIIDVRRLNSVEIEKTKEGEVWATVGGGCQIKHLLAHLNATTDSTLPSLGLITEQTIAGAISTGTHGSGKHSLSHYMQEVRVAAYDAQSGKARIYIFDDGPELQAARCGLGCLGVILSVRFRCVPKYYISETVRRYETIEEILEHEGHFPLQQFFLIPHLWSYYAQQRHAAHTGQTKRSWWAPLYRAYWLSGIDIGLHLVIKLFVSFLSSRRLVRFFYRRVFPLVILTELTLIERSDKALVMEHELFRHLEIEIFVPARHVREAATFVQHVLAVFDGSVDSLDDDTALALRRIGMDELSQHQGTFTHHYPICFRRILPDDTLISMSSGSDEPFYSISFITYAQSSKGFHALASFLASSMTQLFEARPHWGKYFPLSNREIENVYPTLLQFRRICRKIDSKGVFRNEFVTRVLGFVDRP